MLALVDRVLPVDVEDLFRDGSYLIDIVSIIGHNPNADEVCDIVDILVFISFFLQLTRQRLFRLYATFKGVQLDVLLTKSFLEHVGDLLFQFFQLR